VKEGRPALLRNRPSPRLFVNARDGGVLSRSGFWRILAQCVAWLHARRIDRRQHLCAVSHQFETPVELFARQYPASYLLGFSSL